MADELITSISRFFDGLHGDPPSQEILNKLEQKIQFRLRDGDPILIDFNNGKTTVKQAEVDVKGGFDKGVTRFDTDRQTLLDIFQGRLRFSDAIIPTKYNWDGGIKMVENWFLKWRVMTLFGILIRMGQQAPCRR